MRQTARSLTFWNKIFPVIISLIILFPLLSSCSRSKEYDRSDGRYGYNSIDFRIPAYEGCFSYVVNILRCNDKYVIVTYNSPVNDDYCDSYMVYTVDYSGDISSSFEIMSDLYSFANCIMDDKLAVVSLASDKIDLLDLETGALLESIDIDTGSSVVGIEEADDGYVILSSGSITKKYNDGSSKTVTDSNLSIFYDQSSYFEIDGKSYALVYGEQGTKYCEIDFESGKVIPGENPYQLIGNVNYLTGEYVFNSDGIYRADIPDETFNIITKWDCIDIQPEYKSLNGYDYYMIDDDHFAKSYSYNDGTLEVLLFTYDSTIDYSDREILTIGGYNLDDDLALQWAVYLFNLDQDQYRAVCEDYNDAFAWSDSIEAQSSTAALIQYFSEGNAPDIFYGFSFDFDNMGRNGSVIDLSAFIENNNVLSADSVFSTDTSDVYSVYSAYTTVGFFGNSEIVGESGDLSFYELDDLADNYGVTPFYPLRSADITDLCIRYNLTENDLTEDVLEDLINFSIEYGVPYNSDVQFGSIDDVAFNSTILYSSFISDIYSYDSLVRGKNVDLTFVGYPSINGSVHIINPTGIVGVSSSCDCPDVCWDLISYMFNDDVQTILAVNGYIPVDNSVLNDIIGYAVNPDTVPEDDEVIKSYILTDDPVPQDIADEYLNNIFKVDTVVTYDWGVYNIIVDEVNSFDLQGKTPQEIAISLKSRLDLYISENY